MRYALITALATSLVIITGCSSDPEPPVIPQAADTDVSVYTNAHIHTLDTANPQAEAMVTHGDQIIYVGSNAEAQQQAGSEATHYDLGGRFIMPGMIDTHTHPGLVAITGGGDEDAVHIPAGLSKEELLVWLQEYADNSWEPVISLGSWNVAAFLPEGPNKADLDKIFTYRPAILFDDSGHSFWVNSAFLTLMGIDEDAPDVSDVSYFVRDENGKMTGWVKEWGMFPYFGDTMTPAADELKQSLLAFITFLSNRGITTLWDAGNFDTDDAVYGAIAELDKANQLPLRYEASYHIWRPEQIDIAIDELKALRQKYAGNRLHINTIKIHYDGVSEIMTANMLEPYRVAPHGHGGILFTPDRLAAFIQQLEAEDIDLHMHVVGDRATRVALDAVEMARAEMGHPQRIEITLTHLETVQLTDIPRFKALDVHANFTPHWFGDTAFGAAGHLTLGKDRAFPRMLAQSFAKAGANVTLSSDVTTGSESYRADPFIGLQMSATRLEFTENSGPVRMGGEAERLPLATAIAGYTLNGARQLGREHELGSLAAGKKADFVILNDNPFEIDIHSLHQMAPRAVVLGGAVVSGSLAESQQP